MQNFCLKYYQLSYEQAKYLTFDPCLRGQWGGVNFDTVVLTYMHWAIMAHIENLFDIIALGNSEVPYNA